MSGKRTSAVGCSVGLGRNEESDLGEESGYYEECVALSSGDYELILVAAVSACRVVSCRAGGIQRVGGHGRTVVLVFIFKHNVPFKCDIGAKIKI